MEEIEYLEEYEDLVLPALNSAAAAAASSTSTSITKTQSVADFAPKYSEKDDDGSSSSLDQDIFNCLFDDHSDDDDDNIEKIADNASLNQKRESHASLDSLDLLVDNLGEQVAKEIALAKAQQEQKNTNINAKAQEAPKITPSTSKTFVTTPSVSTLSLNKSLPIIKQKSVATVRPTVQQQQCQNTNLIQRSSFVQQRPTSSTAKTSSFSSVKPTTSKSAQLPSSTSSAAAAASTLSGNKFKPKPAVKTSVVTKFVKRPTTIIKPEKIITTDPVEDPLNLDDLSEAASDKYSLSDISGETYNSISDFYEEDEDDNSGDNDEYFDDDLEGDISSNSQIIELSNDSSGSTLNLEELRATTPSPVISQDQDLPSSSFGFNKRKTKSPQLLRNHNILEGLLTIGEKPKLLELINQYDCENNSLSEEVEEGEVNEVIDITASNENLLENIAQTEVTYTSDTIIIPKTTCDTIITTTTTTTTTTTQQENKLTATNNTINPTPTDKNKSETVNISVTAMENSKTPGRDLKSPGAGSDDSYLSAVEELLEESYAEAMKKLNDSDDPAVDELLEESYAEAMKKLKDSSTLQNQEVGAEMEISGEAEVVGTKESGEQMAVKNQPEKDAQTTTKQGVVIEYQDNLLNQDIKEKETKEENKQTENIQKVTENAEIKQMEIKQNDKEENHTKDEMITDNPLDKTQQIPSSLENNSKEQPSKETVNTENKAIIKQSDSMKSPVNESPNTRKKKRFRNLTSPEPAENKEIVIIEETVTDSDDFKGFEDVECKNTESTPQLNVARESVEKEQTKQKDNVTDKKKLSVNDSAKVSTSSAGSFKSPAKTHKSSTDKSKDSPSTSSDKSRDGSPTKTQKSSSDKSKDTKHKSSRDGSKDSKSSRDGSKDSKSSRDSTRESKDKHHHNSSKDKSSRESSKDKNSRERSKDRSRESSKDSSKHNISVGKSTQDKSPHKYTTETSSKHHHKDHRKSRDSKDSSKSRESSKSRDNKESKEKKLETKDSHNSSSSTKKDSKTIHVSKDKTDKKDKESSKIYKDKENNTKQAEESKDKKVLDKTKDIKDQKSATEKVADISKNKQAESMNKPQVTSKTSTPSTSGKSLVNPVKVLKSSTDLKVPKDKKDLHSSRDSSTDRKDISKTKDSNSGEADKKSKDIKKSDTSSRESSKDRKDTKKPIDLKDVKKTHTVPQSPSKKNLKDSNQSSMPKDVKHTNESSSCKDSKLIEKSKELKSSQDNKTSNKLKDSSKETKNDLNDNTHPKGVSLKQTPTKSSSTKHSTSTLKPSKSTKDVLDNKKNEKNSTSSHKDPKEDKDVVQVCEQAKNQEKNDSFGIVEKKKESSTIGTKSEKLKTKETAVNKPKAKELESGNAKTLKSEDILEIKTVSNKDTKEIKTKSQKLTLGTPVIILTRLENIKPKENTKTEETKVVEGTDNKTINVDNIKMEGSKSKESKVEVTDATSNKIEKDGGESKETVTEKKDGETKDGIVEKKTEPRKFKLKRSTTKLSEVKSQENKDNQSKNLKSQEVATLTEKKLSEIKDKNMEIKADQTKQTKSQDIKDVDKTVKGSKDDAVQNNEQVIKTAADSKSEESKSQKVKTEPIITDTDKKDEIPKPMKTRKSIGTKSEKTKGLKDTEKKISETKHNKDNSVVLKSQEDKNVYDKKEEESEPIKTMTTIDLTLEETEAFTDKEEKLKSQGDTSVHDKNEKKSEPMITRKSVGPKSEETKSQKAKTATGKAKDMPEENKMKPMKNRKSFEPKLEAAKSAEIAVPKEKAIDKSEVNKTEPRKTRNGNDSKTEEQKSIETSDSAEKKVEDSKSETKFENTSGLMEKPKDKLQDNKPEPRKTRNQNDLKTEGQKSKETCVNAEKKVETNIETKSEKTVDLVDKAKDEFAEPKPRITRNRHDSKTEEQKSKETSDSAEKKVEENKSETADKAQDECVENKPEPRITRNRHDSKTEEQKSKEISDSAEKKVEENKTETADKAQNEGIENKPEPRITRNRHDSKTEGSKSKETSDSSENKSETADKAQDEGIENKPEPRVTRNRHDSKTEGSKSKETSDSAENKSETADKAQDEGIENKPEPRVTRNRHDSKTEEQKSTETSDNAENKIEKNKSEISTKIIGSLTEKAKNELMENTPESRKTRNRHEEQKSKEISGNAEKKVEETESETKTEKTEGLEQNVIGESLENKPEPRKTRNRLDINIEEQKSKVEETKIENTTGLAEKAKDESLENKPEPRKTRNADKKVGETKSENKSEKTADFDEKNIDTEEQKSKETSANTERKIEETAGLAEKVIDESLENKPEPRKTRNADKKVGETKSENKSEKTTDFAEKNIDTEEQKSKETSANTERKIEETKTEKTAGLAEKGKAESLEYKPEPRKTRNRLDLNTGEQKSKDTSVNTKKKVEETKSETKAEKTAGLDKNVKDESLDIKPEPRKTRNRLDVNTEEQKSEETIPNSEETNSETNVENTLSGLAEKTKDESVENKPEPRKTRNTDKKVEETKSDNKSEKTADFAEKSIDTEEQKSKETSVNTEGKIEKTAGLGEKAKAEPLEIKPEPRKTRNADKKIEEIKSENKSEKNADLAEKTIDKSEENKPEPRKTRNRRDSKTEDHKTSPNLVKQVEETKNETKTDKTVCLKAKDESVENKSDHRKTRSRHDSKSEEQNSEETSQNAEKTVDEHNKDLMENKTEEYITEPEKAKNHEKVKSEETKSIVKDIEEESKVENQLKDDKVLSTENDTSADKGLDSKETVNSEITNNEKLENEKENTTETETESLKDTNETATKEDTTSKSQQIQGDLIKDNISVISDSSSISTTASISSSDTPTRRTLRKRGTESPFPENDNNKKIFKEPPAKFSIGTPKTTKNEKTPTDIVSPSSTTYKRNLRSPAFEADTTQNVAKKPRLESPGRKSARFRNLNDDCLEEVELPVVTANFNDGVKEIVSDLTPNIAEASPSVRKSIRREIPQDKSSEQVQEPQIKISECKKTETVVTKDKSQKQNQKESTKTLDLTDPLEIEQLHKNVLSREVLEIEVITDTSTQPVMQENVTTTKPNVSGKKLLRSEEVKNPKVIKISGNKVKTDAAVALETEPLIKNKVVDIETIETNTTEMVDTSLSQSLAQDDLSGATKQNVNAKKPLRSEEVQTSHSTNIEKSPTRETLDRTKTKKVTTSPYKSPSSVLSFSDWLKNKTETEATEVKDIPLSQQTATDDSLKVVVPRRRRRIKKKFSFRKHSKSNVVQNKATINNTNNTTQEETTLPIEIEPSDQATSLLEISNNTSTTQQDSTLSTSMLMAQTTLEDDNSLLEPALNQITEREVPTKHRGRQFGNRKSRPNIVKRLKRPARTVKKETVVETPQAVHQFPPDNITPNVTINEENNKSNSSLDKSNTKRRSERELLIESMSKEMKEGGIQDLLNLDTHVKRQRLASRKKITSSTEQLNVTTTETVDARISSDVLLKESPKVIEFSADGMSDVAPKMMMMMTQTKENIIKSPSKKSRKSLQTKEPLIKYSTNDDVLSDVVSETSVPKDVAATIEANSEAVIIKKLKSSKKTSIHREKELQTTQNISAEPIPPAEVPSSLPVVAKSRKSIGSTKRPINEAQIAMNKSNRFVNKVNTDVFKTPKPITHSAILNKIPPAEDIKQFYTDTNIRPTSRNMEKFKDKKNLATTFKCHKLRVRLNRSAVKRHWNSLQQMNLVTTTYPKKVMENLHSANVTPVIQHNRETNIRIQSVVSTANVLSEPLEISATENSATQDSVSQQLEPHNTIPSIIDNQPYFVPTTLPSTSFMPVDGGVPLELKYEFVEENPQNLENSILPDTPTLLARAHTITQAAQHALSNSATPTDIRLLTTESSTNEYVSSFGVAPTALNNKGTCLYTFLHPAKYNRNHSNVLLDFCCPNLDGPMPAIDPTRIHAQVQTPVIELPACIVLTTKVVTRAELESKTSSIPAIIRKKAERIRSNIAAHHNLASAAPTPTATVTQSTSATVVRPTMTQPHLAPPPRLQPQPKLSSAINALAKHLPPTTTITPKMGLQPSAAHHPPTVSVTAKGQPSVGNRISNYIQPLRSNLRRFDVLQKQLCQPFDSLTFVDRHRIIESIITSGKLSPNDLERTLILMEEYLTQISLLKSQANHIYTIPSQNSATSLPSLNQMPQLQPAPNILASSSSSAYATTSNQLEKLQNKSIRKVKAPNSGETEQHHVPIYDTDRNIIGYQLQPMSAKPAYTKSTMSSRTRGGIMSTSSLENQITSYSISKRPMKRPAQDSPRVFYTKPPLQTSTPIAANPHIYNTNPSCSKALAQKTHQQGSIVTTVRSSGGSNQSGSSETITTTTMATVKRVTRSTATGSKIIIVSKSNQSSEETILPDVGSSQSEAAEIKNENDMDDFIG